MFGIFTRPAARCGSLALAVLALFTPGCLDRPVCADCEPETINIFTARVPTKAPTRLDLLFMIDGSASMADKQELLAKAVPTLLSRFVNPLCVDDEGRPNGEQSRDGACAQGSAEFPPVRDIHIGVISSSLGTNGGDDCGNRPFANDKAWLLPRARAGTMTLPSYDDSGFLAWDPAGTGPPGTRDQELLRNDFVDTVTAVGESGCGFEASLESWYRFLIDPDPPERVVIENDRTVAVGTDTILLEQRSRFLRPDSIVAIVMLTDENDCSFGLGESSWYLMRTDLRMPRATSACAQGPLNPCCRSCGSIEDAPPNGCAPLAEDSECKRGAYLPEEDPGSMRCFDQKRRFGVDFLEPVEKYVRGLTSETVLDRHYQQRPNPLFISAPGQPPRAPERVFLAGIVGVPWQSIATPESLTGPGLEYLSADELVQLNRWDMILGDPATGKPPSDPHMIESLEPRGGAHPLIANGAIADATGTNPRADVISGHEQIPDPSDPDLQYACIFERETPLPCTASGQECDCRMGNLESNRPLCQPPGGGPAGTTQYFAKAYPGLRQLQVLKSLGPQGVVASICPKVPRSANPGSDPSYGYNPALDALVASLAGSLSNQCLARAPALDDQGDLRCVVVEAQLGGPCDCARPGRSPARAEVVATLREDLAEDGTCGADTGRSCASLCACELAAHEGAALEQCRTNLDPSTQAPGYCYIDPAAGLGSERLVADCPKSKQRLLRFVGADTPTPGAFAYMACMGTKVETR